MTSTGFQHTSLICTLLLNTWQHLLLTTSVFRLSAGCHFISTMHATYPKRSSLRVLPRSYKLGGPSQTPIFDHLGAASWHRGDASFIVSVGYFMEWLLVPWKLVFVFIASIVCTVGYLRYRRMIQEDAERQREEDKELALLSSESSSEAGFDL